MNRQPHNSGFTLIELLVALAIVTTIVSMVYGSYAATSQSLGIHRSRLTCSLRASLVLRLMGRQIRCAYAEATTDASDPEVHHGEAGAGTLQHRPPGRVQFDKLSSAFQGNAQDPRGEILSFATTAGFGSDPGRSSGPSQVRYRWDATAGILSVSGRPYADRLGREDRNESWRPLMRNVTGVDIEFHDGRQWRPKWDGKQSRGLPRAVRIGIDTENEKGRPCRFGTTIPVLGCTAPENGPRKHVSGGDAL